VSHSGQRSGQKRYTRRHGGAFLEFLEFLEFPVDFGLIFGETATCSSGRLQHRCVFGPLSAGQRGFL